jgi:hypothetical protein
MGEAASKLYTSAEYDELVLAVETARRVREQYSMSGTFSIHRNVGRLTPSLSSSRPSSKPIVGSRHIHTFNASSGSVERLVANLLSVSTQLLKCKHVTLFFVDEARNLLVAGHVVDQQGCCLILMKPYC